MKKVYSKYKINVSSRACLHDSRLCVRPDGLGGTAPKRFLVKFSGIYACQSLCDVKLEASQVHTGKLFLVEDKTSKPELGMSAEQNKIL